MGRRGSRAGHLRFGDMAPARSPAASGPRLITFWEGAPPGAGARASASFPLPVPVGETRTLLPFLCVCARWQPPEVGAFREARASLSAPRACGRPGGPRAERASSLSFPSHLGVVHVVNLNF